MRGEVIADGLTSARCVLRERCCTLGLPTLRVDISGRLVSEPRGDESAIAGGESVRALVTSPYILTLLRKAARGWADDDHPEPSELFPGCWGIPVFEVHRRRRIGYVIALAFEPRVVGSEQLHAACQSASLDHTALCDVLRPLAAYDPLAIVRIARMLLWTINDRLELAINEETLCGFSSQLTEAYEELSLLFKLGQSMNELAHPRKFVRVLCDELHATLSYRWVAARFADDARVARHMAGRCMHSGDPNMDADSLLALSTALMSRISSPEPLIVAPADLSSTMVKLTAPALVHPLHRDGRLLGVLIAAEKQGDDTDISNVDMKILDGAGQYLSILLQNASLYDDQQSMFLGTLEALSASIDAKDRYTCGHSERVAHLAVCLAQRLGLSDEVVERIRIGGLVHDVGKIGVPETVLCKPGRLTDEEFEIVKAHPEIGHRILRDIPQLADVLPAVLHHHERWDGRGYPHGLCGHAIPFFARIIGLADAFDAMSSTRTYRSAMPRQDVLAEIMRCAGQQFDPELAPIFVTLDFTEYDALVARHVERERQGLAHGRAA